MSSDDLKGCGGGGGGGGGSSEREEMEKLFLVLLRRQHMQEVVRMLGAEFCCPVCQSLLSLATLANCGHMYCHRCIRTWCVDYERRNCPVCRVQIVARIRALPVDRFIRRCLEEAGERELLQELLAAAAKDDDGDGSAPLFEVDRAPVRSTAATFYLTASGASDQRPAAGSAGRMAAAMNVRSTSATSAGSGGSLVGSFGVSSD